MSARYLAAVGAALCWPGLPAAGHEGHAHAPRTGEPLAGQWAAVTVPDVALLDHDGQPRRLKSELIGERIVVVDFVYTSCTTACPLLSAAMAQLQSQLGPRLGGDVVLLSVTVDPARDTPARLRAHRARLKAGPHWHWLTGPKPVIDGVLRAFGAYAPRVEDHPASVLVGDAQRSRFLRLDGFPGPRQLIDAIARVEATRGAPSGSRT